MSAIAAPAAGHLPHRATDIGAEKFCVKCRDWWPADAEFFHIDKDTRDGLFCWCKACHHEWKTAHKAKKASATTITTGAAA